MSGKTILGGISVTTGGQTIVYAISFLRNVILARLLTQADFGLAAVFALAVAMMELAGRMAIGRQVVQDVEGDTQLFLNTAHVFQAMAAAISAVLLLLLCRPAAHLFKVPDLIWAFALLALVPLLRGFENLDFHRRQRHLEFLPAVWVELVPQIVVTALTYPLALWVGDFRVVLLLILSKSLLTLAMTHLLASRKYRWGWDKNLARKMWYFSWPLIINGFLMYGSHEGDKLLVGIGYSIEVLALYAVCVMFISAPLMIIAHASGTVILPVLAGVQQDSARFNLEYRMCLEACAVAAIAIMLPLILGGEQILKLVFGPRYSGGGVLMAWLAAASAFRLLRIAPAIAAMARADTKNNLFANLFRSSALIPAVVVVMKGGSVAILAACMLFGEVLALAGSVLLLKKRLNVPGIPAFKASIYTSVCLLLAGSLVVIGANDWSLPAVASGTVLLMMFCLLFGWFMFPGSAGRFWMIVKVNLVKHGADPKADKLRIE